MMRITVSILAVFALSGCMEDQPDVTQTNQIETISWDEALALVADCKVDTAYQSHQSDIWLTLHDGSEVQTKAPGLDVIVTEIDKHSHCGDVGIIME